MRTLTGNEIVRAVFQNEVNLALGCTEIAAVAFAAAKASSILVQIGFKPKLDDWKMVICIDAGTYKNSNSVCVPKTNGGKGPILAAVLGAINANPEEELEVLKTSSDEDAELAQRIIGAGKISRKCRHEWADLHIDLTITWQEHEVKVVVQERHNHIGRIVLDGENIHSAESSSSKDEEKLLSYREILRECSIDELCNLANSATDKDRQYIEEGVRANLALAEEGMKLRKVGYGIKQLMQERKLSEDALNHTQSIVAAATDARMAGSPLPAMSSGGSGNQGIVAVLVPYLVGTWEKKNERVIMNSIILSHLLNSYVKCFMGELSPICGCSVAAGVGAAGAIAYQQEGGVDIIRIAINNLIADISGVVCDGAKGSCALKVSNATRSAVLSAHLAINKIDAAGVDGMMGENTEDSIQNLGKLSRFGMVTANHTLLDIMSQR